MTTSEIVSGETAQGASVTLSLCGRLDTTSADEFQQTLIGAFKKYAKIELDMAKLLYISSAGLRVLLMGQKMSKAKNVEMTVVNVSSDVMDVFHMTRFDALLKIV